MNIAAFTDIGSVRKLNEDSFSCFTAGELDVMLVADGMGGHNAGEVASRLAVETVRDFIEKNVSHMDIAELLRGSLMAADDKILRRAEESDALSEMGTTAVLACIKGHTAFFASVGDSRAYVMDKFGIKQITRDDSVVAELVRRGEITAEEAKTHPQRNIITQAVGTRGGIEPHISRHVCKAGDVVLLCSDGLYGMVDDSEIFEIIKRCGAASGAEKLIELANARGGTDNITVTAAEIDGGMDL